MKYSSQIKSMPLDIFTPNLAQLHPTVVLGKLDDSLPWDKIELIYNFSLNNGKRGAGNKSIHNYAFLPNLVKILAKYSENDWGLKFFFVH